MPCISFYQIWQNCPCCRLRDRYACNCKRLYNMFKSNLWPVLVHNMLICASRDLLKFLFNTAVMSVAFKMQVNLKFTPFLGQAVHNSRVESIPRVINCSLYVVHFILACGYYIHVHVCINTLAQLNAAKEDAVSY